MNLAKYIKDNMVIIPKGQELIRDFVDQEKWISSNSKMSIPGSNEKTVKQKTVDIQPFLLLNTLVTNEVYAYVMGFDYDIKTKDFPVVNVSWIDAIIFCNNISEKLGLDKCYKLNSISEKIKIDNLKNGFRLPNDDEWQTLVEEIQKDMDMVILKILLGMKKIQTRNYIRLK